LTLTANTQPAILATSIVALDALAAAGIRCEFVAVIPGRVLRAGGRGAIDFADGIRTVRARGQFMQEAVPAGEGAMAAILGLDARWWPRRARRPRTSGRAIGQPERAGPNGHRRATPR